MGFGAGSGTPIKHQEGIVCEPLHVNNSSGSWRGFSNNRKQLASILQLRLFSFRQTAYCHLPDNQFPIVVRIAAARALLSFKGTVN